MILKFRVSEQTISALNTKSVPRIGSKDYLVFQFSFSNDWDGLTKTAYLQRDSVSVPIEIKDGLVEVPEWFTEQESFNVTIFGTDGTKEVPTNVVAVKLEKSNDLWVKDAPEPTPSWITELIDLSNHPPIPGSNGFWLLWDTDRDEYVESQLPLPEATTGGTSDHSKLVNRDAADQHPMSAITGLEAALDGKQPAGDYLTEEQDPTVPGWAKQPQKPAYTAQEVGALPATTTIPTALSELSEDATHRVVTDAEKAAWNAKSNFTGSYNDLTDKPVIPAVPVQSVNGKTGAVVLSADDVGALPASTVIPSPYTLPIANETTLGGVKPVAKTAEMTQPVGVDAAGALWGVPGSGGGGDSDFSAEYTLAEDVSQFVINIPESVSYFELYVHKADGATVPTVSTIQAVIAGYRCNGVGSELSGSIGYLGMLLNKGEAYWDFLKVAYFSENNVGSMLYSGNLLRYSDSREDCIIINGKLYAKNVITIKARR